MRNRAPHQIYVALGRPSGIYSLWSTEQRRSFYVEHFGRPARGDLEYMLWVHQTNDDGSYVNWLNARHRQLTNG